MDKGENDMPSDFWIKKMKTHYNVIDIDRDGAITPKDFVALADRFIEVGNLSDQEAASLRDRLNTIWENYWVGADIDGDGQVSENEYINTMTKVMEDSTAREGVGGPLYLLFKVIDTDRSGTISPSEHETFFKCMGINADHSAETFAAIDADNDGFISEQEFASSGKAFFLSEDDNHPSRSFWGPLIA
jgi:Ca2+-binding EF-hand superfamily protein